MIRSSVLLAACLGLWSCTSDPTADEAGVPTAIVASPEVVFVDQGATQLLRLGLVDELGGLIPSTWTIGAVPAEFTVTIDSSFRVVYNSDGTLTLPDNQSEIRVTLTGVTSGAGSFNVSASGITLPVTVSIVPTNVPATFNTTTPQIGENLVLTMPEGLILLADATFSAGAAAPPIVVSRAPDGSSVTLLVAPGTASPITIAGVTPDFADLELTLNTTETITATTTSTYVGTDALGTAPPITVPPVGGSSSFYDIPSDGTMYYMFTVATTTTLKFTIDWAAGANGDIDIAWYTAAGAFLGYFGAGTGAHPEVSTHTYAAGSYIMSPEIYDGSPGAWYIFTVEAVSAP